MLDPHLGTIIWTIITFMVVLVILKIAVWPTLLSALEEREQRIAAALEGAEKARDEAQAILEEHRQKLAEADAEGRNIVLQAREAAEKTQQEIVGKAQAEAQQALEQARRSIDSEKRAAIEELRRHVADLAVQAAGAIIEANLDDERNRKLVDDLITAIPNSAANGN
jgi:F-type H+-transporting ATPase subunit b